MIVSRELLGPILQGKADQLTLRAGLEPPPVGSIRALQTRVGKDATCLIEVLDVAPQPDGAHTVKFKLHTEMPVRLMNKSGNYPYYTEDPDQALPGEDEAVDDQTLQRFSMEAGQGNAARTAAYEQMLRERPLSERLRLLEEMHDRGDVDLSRMLAPIRRRLDAAERKAFQQRAA